MRKILTILVAATLVAGPAAPGLAQAAPPASTQMADPASAAANSDLAPVTQSEAPQTTGAMPADPAAPAPATPSADTPVAAQETAQNTPAAATYHQQDILAAAENAFGKGAEGLAKMVEKVFREKGEPSAYIIGREGGGALLVGLRYGSGTMAHKVEGNLPVYWTGPSLGIDIGANGAKTFMLVYNLHDSNDLYKRFPGAEGNAYAIGGFTASHHRSGDVVVVPIHVGMGWRLGANIGYLKFSKTSKISPF